MILADVPDVLVDDPHALDVAVQPLVDLDVAVHLPHAICAPLLHVLLDGSSSLTSFSLAYTRAPSDKDLSLGRQVVRSQTSGQLANHEPTVLAVSDH